MENQRACSKRDNCSLRHDINKRAKSKPPNPSPSSFMRQNERNASRTRGYDLCKLVTTANVVQSLAVHITMTFVRLSEECVQKAALYGSAIRIVSTCVSTHWRCWFCIFSARHASAVSTEVVVVLCQFFFSLCGNFLSGPLSLCLRCFSFS